MVEDVEHDGGLKAPYGAVPRVIVRRITNQHQEYRVEIWLS